MTSHFRVSPVNSLLTAQVVQVRFEIKYGRRIDVHVGIRQIVSVLDVGSIGNEQGRNCCQR